MMGPVIGSLTIAAVVVIAIAYFWRLRIKSKENIMRLTAKIEGVDEMEVGRMGYIDK